MVELTPFKRVIGVDPSAKMIESAREMTLTSALSTSENQFEYLQSSAESLPFLEDESVDLVVSGEYRHVWFCLGSVYWAVFWLCSSGCALVWLSENVARDG